MNIAETIYWIFISALIISVIIAAIILIRDEVRSRRFWKKHKKYFDD